MIDGLTVAVAHSHTPVWTELNWTEPTEFRSTIPDQNSSETYCKAIFDSENEINWKSRKYPD